MMLLIVQLLHLDHVLQNLQLAKPKFGYTTNLG